MVLSTRALFADRMRVVAVIVAAAAFAGLAHWFLTTRSDTECEVAFRSRFRYELAYVREVAFGTAEMSYNAPATMRRLSAAEVLGAKLLLDDGRFRLWFFRQEGFDQARRVGSRSLPSLGRPVIDACIYVLPNGGRIPAVEYGESMVSRDGRIVPYVLIVRADDTKLRR